MKKYVYYAVLTATVGAALALLGVAAGYAIIQPDANYHYVLGSLPENGIPDCLASSVCLLLAALVCFAGSLLMGFLNYDGQEKDGGGAP